MGVSDVVGGFVTRRVSLPGSGVESWTVVGPDLRPVVEVDEYLAWLTSVERSPNTIEAYARDLRLFWQFLAEVGVDWDAVDVAMLGEFALGRVGRRRTSWWCTSRRRDVQRGR
jgi:hypothetical protein